MKKLLILLMSFSLLVLAGCGKEKETKDSSYDTLVQNFVDVYYGNQTPTRETVKSLRHEAMWDNFETEYNDYLQDWTYNNGVLKEVFGEDYTCSVAVVSSTGDTRAREAIEDLLNRLTLDAGAVSAYTTLKLEITFSGNGKTYVAQGRVDVFACFEGWYTVNSTMESVNNVKE